MYFKLAAMHQKGCMVEQLVAPLFYRKKVLVQIPAWMVSAKSLHVLALHAWGQSRTMAVQLKYPGPWGQKDPDSCLVI